MGSRPSNPTWRYGTRFNYRAYAVRIVTVWSSTVAAPPVKAPILRVKCTVACLNMLQETTMHKLVLCCIMLLVMCLCGYDCRQTSAAPSLEFSSLPGGSEYPLFVAPFRLPIEGLSIGVSEEMVRGVHNREYSMA